jgi:ABC-type branched-subunit amino acid transport system ATPase component/sugar phosphate permease
VSRTAPKRALSKRARAERDAEPSVPDDVRTKARAALGIETGEASSEPLRSLFKRTGVGWYPLVSLGVLVAVDEWQGVAFGILGPDIARTLGLSKGAIATVLALKLLAISIATLPMAAYVQNRPRRAAIAIVSAFAWATVTIYTGFVAGVLVLIFVLLLDGISTGSVSAVHIPLLMDSYPPEARVRAVSAYKAFDTVGLVAAPLLIALLSSVFFLTWRGVFLVMGLCSLSCAAIAIRLRDPGFGHYDTARIREMMRSGGGMHDRSELEEKTQLRFFEVVRRLFVIPTARRVLAAFAVLGVMIVPLGTFFAFFLEERWGMNAGARALLQAFFSLAAIAGLPLFGKFGDRMYSRGPDQLVRLAAWMLLGQIGLIVLGAIVPVFGLMVLFFGISSVLTLLLGVALNVPLLGIIPASMRPHASALSAIYLAGVGGIGGALLLGTIDRRFGVAGAMVAVAIPGVVGSLLLRSASKTVMADIDRTIDQVVEEEEIRNAENAGGAMPLLACRSIDFSYGQVQVLFGVDFTVDDGEMVALLGVNGAGKSTLLRAISGLGLPSRGSVRLHGVDITYLDAERRTALGISQVPGGKAVFPPMTVLENLKMFAYTLGRSRQKVDAAIDEALGAFPRLAERRDQLASTLSGGEQQMLALCKAKMLKPQLLLIDELSLGLAPTIVGPLLDMVRAINADGTAVVLVEQSVNVALSLVEHAYFMEKGEIRFDGSAQDLLAREDLLRAVFLKGTTDSSARGVRGAAKRPRAKR